MLQKRKGGRPKIYGMRSLVQINLEIDLIGKIDTESIKQEISRTELITNILRKELG